MFVQPLVLHGATRGAVLDMGRHPLHGVIKKYRSEVIPSSYAISVPTGSTATA